MVFCVQCISGDFKKNFLEGRFYTKVPVSRFAYLIRIKRWFKASCTMGLMTVQKMAWSLTVIGGIIKRYSYFLVPYIVAENPDIAPKKAIKLSRTMMYGHKWECFVFEVSYWGWGILNLFTLGITGILYSNPYKIAALSEYYVGLRRKAIEGKTEGCEYLNDTYLYELASDDLIKTVYAEDMKDLEGVTEEENPLRGIPGFLADVFSISVMGLEKEREFEAYQIRQIRYKMIKETIEKRTYPNKLFPTPEEKKAQKSGTYALCKMLQCLVINGIVFRIFICRMDMGGMSCIGAGRNVRESWRTAWTVAANLWKRRGVDSDYSEQVQKQTDD